MERKMKIYQLSPGRLAKKLFTLLVLLSLSFNNSIAQEKIVVTGTVTDAQNNEALPGVSITEAGTTTGTISDVDGNYSLNISPNAVMHFSYIGYLSVDVPVDMQTAISIALELDAIGLEEIIVTGYGVQRKSDVTGSIASVSSEKLNEIPIAGVDQALQGLAAGVNVIPVSGRPGEAAVIQIRGISSINGTEPLIIVDGVPGSLEGISPSEIESIEILKDASSAAIYGDSGGNGVILITTKKGKAGKMKTHVNFYQGIETPVSRIDLMNSQQWLSTLEETYPGDIAITSQPDTMTNYDWQEIIFQPAFTQNYDITSSGGSDVSTYMFSASYNKQSGIIRSSDYDRFTLRLNSEHKLSKRITFDEKISVVARNRYGLPDWQWNAYYDGPVRQALIMQPNVPDYNGDGTWANSDFGGSNPLAQLDMVDRVAKNNNFNGNFGVKVDILKGLSFTSRFAGGLGFWDNKEFQNSYENTVYDFRNDDQVKIVANMGRTFSYTAQQLLNYNATIAEDHNIALLAGMEANRNWGYDYGGERFMSPNTPANLQYFIQSVNDTAINQIIDGGAYETRGQAYLGRVNYDYKGKYLFTANIRRSGRSSFGPDYRYGVFPSFSVGWKFSKERFMENQDVISFGKIRYGYGQVGTYARSGNPYLSIVRSPQTFAYPFNNSSSSPGAAPVQIANSEIHWETIHMSNIGIDLAMFNNRLSLTAEYYNKVNEDMLMLQEVPFIAGSYTLGSAFDIDDAAPEVNIGSIRNSGIELTMGYKDQIGDFHYNFDMNVSTLKNEVLKLASDSLYGGSVHNIDPITITRVGGSVSEFYGYQSDGLFTREDCAVDASGNYILNSRGEYTVVNQPFITNDDGDTVYAQPQAQPGDRRYLDLDDDGKVLQPGDKTSLGSPIPKLIFGFSLNLEYKGIDLAAQFTGALGHQLFNGTKQYLFYYQGYNNHATEFADRYIDADLYKDDPVTGEPVVVVHENIDTDIARNKSINYARPSDFYIEDASYLRLRNITLGYTLPASVTKAINIERLRLYVGARNLWTWTTYKGINPEIGNGGILEMGIDASIYPVTKMYFWGVNLSF
jgi:TonB-dependent starch-binding outer membrane protein SusC